MTRVIRHEALNLKTQWNLIPNQSNIKILNDEIKKKIYYTKEFKKKNITIKRMRIKIKNKINFIFD